MLQSRLPQPPRTPPCGRSDQRQRYLPSLPRYRTAPQAADDGPDAGQDDDHILLLSRAQLDDMMLAARPHAALQSQFTHLARQVEEARADQAKLQAQVERLTAQLRQAELARQEWQSKAGTLATELVEAQTTNDRIRSENARREAELRHLQARYDALEATCTELAESNRVSAEVNRQVVRDAYRSRVELQRKRCEQERSSEALEKQLQDQQQSLEQLEKQLADQAKNNETLTKDLCDERQGRQRLELQHSRLCHQLNRLQQERRKLLHQFNAQSLAVQYDPFSLLRAALTQSSEAAIWTIENEIGQLAHSIITSGSAGDPDAIQQLLTTHEYLQAHADLQFIPVSFPGGSPALRARAVQRLFAMYLAAHVWTPRADPSLLTLFVSLLRKLIPGDEHGELRARVDAIIHRAADVWDDLHRKGYSVAVTVDPTPAPDGWMAVRDGCVDGPCRSDRESWCVFPRVEASVFNARTVVLFPGRALFF
ncbi:hypothetical protein VTN02DRAFT_3652 [Thermoascus thermophilus]